MQLGKLAVLHGYQDDSCKTAALGAEQHQWDAEEKQNRTRTGPPDPESQIAAPTAIGNGGKFRKASTNSEWESITNFPDVEAVLTDARREIAVATLTELDFQSHRLGELIRDGLLEVTLAADTLYDAALSNGLIATHGDDAIQRILAAGIGGAA